MSVEISRPMANDCEASEKNTRTDQLGTYSAALPEPLRRYTIMANQTLFGPPLSQGHRRG